MAPLPQRLPQPKPTGSVPVIPTMDDTIRFETSPDRYRHWKLTFPDTHHGAVAVLAMDVQEDAGLRPGYPLKLNSYDLGVDIELADAIQRIRFEHPAVRALVVTSARDRIFSAGANIYMLGSSTHTFKVNFCKYTNETRVYLEELSQESGVPTLAAINGTASGGGYELVLACDEAILQDDGNAAVSLPEAPLLAVLPGTGGLTRLVDKRKVRRDLADVFSTLAEGVRGRRAVEWRLVDEVAPRSRFEVSVRDRTQKLIARSKRRATGEGVRLDPLDPARTVGRTEYRHVTLTVDDTRRVAEITLRGPIVSEASRDPRTAGADAWALRAFRELDDAILDLRFNHPTAGLILLRTQGDPDAVRSVDRALVAAGDDWFVREIRLHIRRVLKRIDLSARSVFALVEPGSCFVGSVFELTLAADRTYMLDDPDGATVVGLSDMNFGPLPMSNGLTRLQTRFLGEPTAVEKLQGVTEALDAGMAMKLGLVTFAPDPIDWDDEVRMAVEERTSLSPDAMTGMEASLRFAGPETMETKIFGRLTAWQNWIFQRPNAVGPKGALTVYGRPERAVFDYKRT